MRNTIRLMLLAVSVAAVVVWLMPETPPVKRISGPVAVETGDSYHAATRHDAVGESVLHDAVSGHPDSFIEPLGVALWAGLPAADAPAPQTVSLRLEDGSQLDLSLTGKEVRTSENYSWIGEVAGQPGSMAVLTRCGDAIDGYLMTLDRGELKVTGKAGASLNVERLHLEKGFCATCARDASSDPVTANYSNDPLAVPLETEAAIAAGANPVIDMLVVYSQRARADLGGTSAMNAAISTAITSLNTTLANSGVALTINLVHTAELEYVPAAADDGGIATGIGRLSNDSDGYVDEAHTLRDTYGADLVSFVIDETPQTSLGMANIFAPWSCMNASTLTGVAPHEWGHNLGCGHNDSGPGQSTLQGVYSYSYAHYFEYDSSTRGTIMSYIGQRFARFSNPNVDWNGIATGTAGRNHALTIENTKTTIGNWRTAFPDYGGKPCFWFETAGDFEGWTVNNISNETVSAGWAGGIAASGDPQLIRTGFNFAGADASTVLVRMQAEINSTADIFWGHTEADSISSDRKVTVSYTASGDPQVLSFDLSSDTNWTAKTITLLRFDPLSLPPVTDKSFSIDWIALTDGDFDADGIADAMDGYGDANADGIPDFAEIDADGDGMDDASEQAAGRTHTNAIDMAFHFETYGDFEGWTNSPMNITGLIVTNGAAAGTAVTVDPYVANHAVGFPASHVSNVTVRIRAGANAKTQLYWAPAGGSFVGNFVDQDYDGSGEWQVLDFQMAGDANWDGNTIDKLRIDPIAATTWFEIDWIRAANGDSDLDGFTDTAEGTGDTDSDSIPDYLDEDSDNDGFTDWQEYVVGTGRTNAAENAFLIPAGTAVSSGTLSVPVNGLDGRLYRLMQTLSLTPPQWEQFDSEGPLSGDQAITLGGSVTNAQGFYRVTVELP